MVNNIVCMTIERATRSAIEKAKNKREQNLKGCAPYLWMYLSALNIWYAKYFR